MNTWPFEPHNGKTVVHVVRVNDYQPELCCLTLPNIEAYARRLNADFNVITERKFPDWPATYEKMQVFELGRENDWNILIDADFLIHPDMFDVRGVVPPNCIGMHFGYDADKCLKPDKYFHRYGHNRGIASGFVVTSWLTHDIWEPLDMTPEEAKANVIRPHIVDEYCLSRNMAKYGLPFFGILPDPQTQYLLEHLGVEGCGQDEMELKLQHARDLLKVWK